MDKLIVKAGAAASTAALVLSSFVGPALAAEVEISGNSSNSDNTATVTVVNSTTVLQTNSANINNNVNVSANTGNNTANDNTGGDVSIDTGKAGAKVDVSNAANSNVAEVSGCCPKDVKVTIKDNGTYSDNDATVTSTTTTKVDQDNTANIKNTVNVDLDTGNNDASDNTGGDVSINTGKADAKVGVANAANANEAVVTSGNGGGGKLAVEISNNGSNSDNTAVVTVASNTLVEQTNYANIKNKVDVYANTGNNTANDNTGGDVSISTGDADADVDVSNLANFNSADVDACGCLLDLMVKIKDNGTYSDNDAIVTLSSILKVDQDNTYDCSKKHHGHWPWHKKGCNNVEVDLDSGNNDANDNTDEGEPGITTGDTMADVMVETEANSNVVGDADFDLDLPDLDLGGSSAAILLLLLALFS